MSCVDESCIGCSFLGTLSVWACCDYILVTGTKRGCKAGRGCDKRIIGDKQPTFAARLYLKSSQEEKKKKLNRKCMSQAEIAEYERARKREAYRKSKEELAGRQRAVIIEYKDRNKVSSKWIASMIGVGDSTVRKWMTEERSADWDKLALLGINRPKGL